MPIAETRSSPCELAIASATSAGPRYARTAEEKGK